MVIIRQIAESDLIVTFDLPWSPENSGLKDKFVVSLVSRLVSPNMLSWNQVKDYKT